MFNDLFGLTWRNMQQARIRLIMTSFGVLVGTAAVVLLIALTNGLQQVAESSVGSNAIFTEVTVYPSALSTFDQTRPPLDETALTTIRELDGVLVAVPLVLFNRRAELLSGRFSNYADLYGIAAADVSFLNLQVGSGELTLPESGSIILGAAVPQFFLDPEASSYEPQVIDVSTDPLELRLQRFDGEERFIGLQSMAVLAEGTSRFDNSAFMPLEDVLAFNEWISDDDSESADVYTQLLIRTSDRTKTRAVSDAVLAMGFQTDDVGEFLDEVNSFFVSMRLVLGLTGGIALLVAAFVVANTMMMSVVERTGEIGLMKAIGARNRDVLTIFLLEAGLVGFGGGVAGIVTALLLGNMINQGLLNQQTVEGSGQLGFLPVNAAMIQGGELIVIPPNLIFFAISLATCVGLLAGFFPAWRAARMTPVHALRQ
jgi:putative ABC transport system permease protein